MILYFFPNLQQINGLCFERMIIVHNADQDE